MEPSDVSRAVLGTTERGAEAKVLKAGPLSCVLHGASLCRIGWDNVEIIRAIDSPIRDENWGTYGQEAVREDVVEDGDILRATRRFIVPGAAVSGERVLTLEATGRLSVALTLTARSGFKTIRAGFTVLHSGGSRQESLFPQNVAAAQPVFDITALEHRVEGIIRFSGGILEMEDPRNWGGSSYKTYCQPLAKPSPYQLGKGETVGQEIVIEALGAKTVIDKARSSDSASLCAGEPRGRLPELLLAVEGDWLPTDDADVAAIALGGLLLRLGDGSALAQCADIAATTGAGLDLEIVVAEGSDPAAHCAAIALPKAYLKSHQPSGPWPAGPTPEDCAAAALAAFPATEIGSGMLTNFTEFNRCPPAPGIGDYVTHGSCAIVHAADDWSVIETLETRPQIFRSAIAIAAGRPYRPGIISIGMRSNPGADVAPNPERTRKAMAIDDPAQQGLFAAACAIGAVAAAADADASAIALAAPVGPLGVTGPGGKRFPISHALQALARLQERPVVSLFGLPHGLAGVAARDDAGQVRSLIANCSLAPTTLVLPDTARARLLDAERVGAADQDPDWLDTAPSGQGGAISHGPCALSFITLEDGR